MLLCGFRGANAHTYTRCKYLPCVATRTCWVPLKSQVSIRAPAENAAEKRHNRSRVPLSHCNDTHIHMDESMDAACVGAGDTCTHACLMHSVPPRHSLFSAIPFSLWGAPFLSRSITLLLTHSNTHTLSLLCAHSLSCSLSRTRALSLSRFSMAFRMGFLVRGFVNKRPW